MSSFMEKFVLAVVAVYLLVGVSSATSTLLRHGGEKSLSHIDCRDGMRKIIGRKGGSFGCQSDFVSKNTVPIRSLRIIVTTSPPSPTKNLRKSQGATAPPPLII
ncbi:hypothetical protein ACE6H2_017938 [Prunus campanulata]